MKYFVTATLALLAAPIFAQPAVAPFEAARDYPVTQGAWNYRATATGSEARFGNALLLRCDRASRTVAVQRIDFAANAAAPLMTIATDTMWRSLPAAGASLAASDSLLDAIAFSRGRVVVSGGGGVTLVVPAWPEAARSIEDCRI